MRKRFFGPTSPTQSVSDTATRVMALATPAAAEKLLPQHDPPLTPRDEAVFLLTAAAEIEHALMVQYLFAAYSINVQANPSAGDLQQRLLQIAREEMGHLMTVQNLLHLLGGPLNFNREQAPYTDEIYPFRFKLEPLTLDSLAKYVMAESPADWEAEEKNEIQRRALSSNDDVPVNHVGPIFASLLALFKDKLADEDFRPESIGFQGSSDHWGHGDDNLLIRTFGGADMTAVRQAACTAINEIAQQGEGQEDMEHSHFSRFLTGFRDFKNLSAGGIQLTWPLAENPNTTAGPQVQLQPSQTIELLMEAQESRGRITDARAGNWARLFNLRYRMLLAGLSHFLRLDQPLATPSGALTPRGLLLNRTFNAMFRLGAIAGKLVQMPKDDPPNTLHAGPPFELPYTLNLPQPETARWRTHLDISKAETTLIRKMLAEGDTDDFLNELLSEDQAEQVLLQRLAAGHDLPEPPPPPPPGPLSFAVDIKGLFRAVPDRSSMLFRLDLHKFEDVRDWADSILERLEDGSMPCDGNWPADRIAKFKQWIAEGKQP